MVVERIFICPPDAAEQREQAVVAVVEGSGLSGDRYFGRHEEPGQNVTFVEAESIEDFARQHGRPGDLSMTRRNIVTRGVRLNELVGREFEVGGLKFRGVELCEPCAGLGERLAADGLSIAGVVKALVHRAGLRADALSSGELRVGARFGLPQADAVAGNVAGA